MESADTMFVREKTVFAKGHILTREMLDLLYRWPRRMMNLYTDDLSDGIISGMSYEEKEGDIVIGSGILKWKGSIWFLPEPLSIRKIMAESGLESGKPYRLQLNEAGASFAGEVCTERLDVLAEKRDREDLCILGKFFFQGNTMPKLPANWEELQKSLSYAAYFDAVEIPFARKGECTFHPLLFKCFAEKLKTKKDRTSLEDCMLVQILEDGTLSMPLLRLYAGVNESTGRRELLKKLDKKVKESSAKEPPRSHGRERDVEDTAPVGML